MKRIYHKVWTVIAFSFILGNCVVNAQDPDLPNVVILATGGTIAGSAETGTQAGYTSGQIGIQTMIEAVPGIDQLANITGEQISNVGSQDMSIEIWLKLANRINELLNSDEVDGIVITHGTDTQEETAFFLNLVVKSDKPVVTTGSMRPSTAVSAEGPLNLYNAVAVAANPKSRGHGVLVVMNDQILGAHSVTKTNTTSVQTFMAPSHGQMGAVIYGKMEFYRNPHGIHTINSEFSVNGVTQLPRVDIVFACADCSADLIDLSIKAGAKGIVIAGVGNGNMTAAMLAASKKAADNGIVVVRSTRVPTGYVLRNAEINDDENNTIASDELNAQKSRVLLMLALLKKRDNANIQELFYNY
ncbi:type II asparaginase [Robiginitalea sp.]|uniref:type II asparaginase n=1 Tax=Robiginitalea sp. TaxID=1902411 RepID=UPI003C71B57B